MGNKFKPGEWNEEERCMCKLEGCAANLKVWMNENRLKMNSDKTEVCPPWIEITIGPNVKQKL